LHAAEGEVGPEGARLRLEAGADDCGLHTRGERGQWRFGLDSSCHDARASSRRKRLERSETEGEGSTAGYDRRDLESQPGNRLPVDLAEEAQRQMVGFGPDPADGTTPRRRLQRLRRAREGAPDLRR
jgi:hypothetical protein